MNPGARARAQRRGRAARGRVGAIVRSAVRAASRAKTDRRIVLSTKNWPGVRSEVAPSRSLSLQPGFFFPAPAVGVFLFD